MMITRKSCCTCRDFDAELEDLEKEWMKRASSMVSEAVMKYEAQARKEFENKLLIAQSKLMPDTRHKEEIEALEAMFKSKLAKSRAEAAREKKDMQTKHTEVEGRLKKGIEDLTAVVQELRRQLADSDDVYEKRQMEREKKQREEHVAVVDKLKAQHERSLSELTQASEDNIIKLKFRCEQLEQMLLRHNSELESVRRIAGTQVSIAEESAREANERLMETELGMRAKIERETASVKLALSESMDALKAEHKNDLEELKMNASSQEMQLKNTIIKLETDIVVLREGREADEKAFEDVKAAMNQHHHSSQETARLQAAAREAQLLDRIEQLEGSLLNLQEVADKELQNVQQIAMLDAALAALKEVAANREGQMMDVIKGLEASEQSLKSMVEELELQLSQKQAAGTSGDDTLRRKGNDSVREDKELSNASQREMIEALQSEYNQSMSALSQQLIKSQEAAAVRYAELEAQYKAALESYKLEREEHKLQLIEPQDALTVAQKHAREEGSHDMGEFIKSLQYLDRHDFICLFETDNGQCLLPSNVGQRKAEETFHLSTAAGCTLPQCLSLHACVFETHRQGEYIGIKSEFATGKFLQTNRRGSLLFHSGLCGVWEHWQMSPVLSQVGWAHPYGQRHGGWPGFVKLTSRQLPRVSLSVLVFKLHLSPLSPSLNLGKVTVTAGGGWNQLPAIREGATMQFVKPGGCSLRLHDISAVRTRAESTHVFGMPTCSEQVLPVAVDEESLIVEDQSSDDAPRDGFQPLGVWVVEKPAGSDAARRVRLNAVCGEQVELPSSSVSRDSEADGEEEDDEEAGFLPEDVYMAEAHDPLSTGYAKPWDAASAASAPQGKAAGQVEAIYSMNYTPNRTRQLHSLSMPGPCSPVPSSVDPEILHHHHDNSNQPDPHVYQDLPSTHSDVHTDHQHPAPMHSNPLPPMHSIPLPPMPVNYTGTHHGHHIPPQHQAPLPSMPQDSASQLSCDTSAPPPLYLNHRHGLASEVPASSFMTPTARQGGHQSVHQYGHSTSYCAESGQFRTKSVSTISHFTAPVAMSSWRSRSCMEEDLLDLSSRMVRGFMLKASRFSLYLCFKLWRSQSCHTARCTTMACQLRQQRLLWSGLLALAWYRNMESRMRNLRIQALGLAERANFRLLTSAFMAWWLLTSKSRSIQSYILRSARTHLTSIMRCWIMYVQARAHSRLSRTQKLLWCERRFTLVRKRAVWMTWMQQIQNSRVTEGWLSLRHGSRTLSSCWFAWRRLYSQQLEVVFHAEVIAGMHFQRWLLLRWHAVSHRNGRLRAAAMLMRHSLLQRGWIKLPLLAWRKFTLLKRWRQGVVKRLQLEKMQRLVSTTFRSWQRVVTSAVKLTRSMALLSCKRDYNRLKGLFTCWWIWSRQQQGIWRLLQAYHMRMLSSALRFWRDWSRQSARFSAVTKQLMRLRSFRISLALFSAWALQSGCHTCSRDGCCKAKCPMRGLRFLPLKTGPGFGAMLRNMDVGRGLSIKLFVERHSLWRCFSRWLGWQSCTSSVVNDMLRIRREEMRRCCFEMLQSHVRSSKEKWTLAQEYCWSTHIMRFKANIMMALRTLCVESHQRKLKSAEMMSKVMFKHVEKCFIEWKLRCQELKEAVESAAVWHAQRSLLICLQAWLETADSGHRRRDLALESYLRSAERARLLKVFWQWFKLASETSMRRRTWPILCRVFYSWLSMAHGAQMRSHSPASHSSSSYPDSVSTAKSVVGSSLLTSRQPQNIITEKVEYLQVMPDLSAAAVDKAKTAAPAAVMELMPGGQPCTDTWQGCDLADAVPTTRASTPMTAIRKPVDKCLNMTHHSVDQLIHNIKDLRLSHQEYFEGGSCDTAEPTLLRGYNRLLNSCARLSSAVDSVSSIRVQRTLSPPRRKAFWDHKKEPVLPGLNVGGLAEDTKTGDDYLDRAAQGGSAGTSYHSGDQRWMEVPSQEPVRHKHALSVPSLDRLDRQPRSALWDPLLLHPSSAGGITSASCDVDSSSETHKALLLAGHDRYDGRSVDHYLPADHSYLPVTFQPASRVEGQAAGLAKWQKKHVAPSIGVENAIRHSEVGGLPAYGTNKNDSRFMVSHLAAEAQSLRWEMDALGMLNMPTRRGSNGSGMPFDMCYT
ncbi:hypothetical protein CEUSTIGMA_g9577.t1 [Chlamydomonas eustigma]|uniref:Uncharacterized protein n=1 Tax=Chlamydomonas eustigma TaxID=1157962 RepID=A0A250XGW0_9CHLO|nr:hypothetical protein CEUSTIGMA_g9577.t1 [Chlamydomonas eustigma]|eukprot:GAX82149.1 hypothetical protein CEUSTIGMA_g9577.t1 [Chlamydomonas eustigma]